MQRKDVGRDKKHTEDMHDVKTMLTLGTTPYTITSTYVGLLANQFAQ